MDFLEEYKTAFVVTGTAALPYPYPASGRVYIVAPAKSLGLAAHFIKIVQVLNEQQFKTWIFELSYLRAVRVPAPASDKSVAFCGWTLKSGDDLNKDVAAALEALDKDRDKGEILLYAQAIVLVCESAPVITRIEFAMTAAECAEHPRSELCPVCPPPHCPKK